MKTIHSLEMIKAPSFLKYLPIWLVWKYSPSETSKKLLKIPFYINGAPRKHDHGSEKDIQLLTDFESAKLFAISHGFSGIGIALLRCYNFAALDFDNCISEDGQINPEVEECILGTYSEISPSGKGIRAFVTGDLGNSKSHANEQRFGIELYSSTGYVTFTGHTTELCQLTDSENIITAPNNALSKLMDARFSSERNRDSLSSLTSTSLGLDEDQLLHILTYQNPDAGYSEWLSTGMALHHETSGAEEGFQLWDDWSRKSSKYSGEEYNRHKWNSFHEDDKHGITIRSLIKHANSQGASIHSGELTRDDFSPITLVENDKPIEKHTSFFHIRSAEEFVQIIRPVSWLIKGFLPKATLGILYGESGSGKSFAALDICAAISRQQEWNGIKPQKSKFRILYIVAEGINGFSQRITAYCQQHDITTKDLPIDIISDVPPNLMDGVSVNHLLIDIQERGLYDLIVMDTFAQVTSGANENSGEDMGKALGYCKKIALSSNAMVLLIHHSGKDTSKGVRGWSGVHAAADVVIEVMRYDVERCIKVIKQKDGIDGMEYGFSLIPIYLGTDEDGDDVTSCIVDYHPVVKSAKKPQLKSFQKLVFDVVMEFTPMSWISINNVIDLTIERIPKEEGTRDIRRQNVKRAINSGIGVFLEENENGEIRGIH
jgi:hypothetical protein